MLMNMVLFLRYPEDKTAITGTANELGIIVMLELKRLRKFMKMDGL